MHPKTRRGDLGSLLSGTPSCRLVPTSNGAWLLSQALGDSALLLGFSQTHSVPLGSPLDFQNKRAQRSLLAQRGH